MRCTFATSVALAVSLAAAAAAAEPVPDRTVVLTFDDAVKSHITNVAPMLRERGFGATFFVTHLWMDDAANFMSWDEIAELHKQGFEIGNHSWTHSNFARPRSAARLAGELALVERALKNVGVPKPVSFGWTGNFFGPEGLEVLKAAGITLARRGMQPEVPYGEATPGPLFDPMAHHPLLIPSAGDAYPNWTIEHFRTVVDRAKDGRIAVIQFHGVPDIAHPWVHTEPELLKACLDYLKQGKFHVIALRDVLPYLPATPPNDPNATLRYYTKEPNAAKTKLVPPVEAEATQADLRRWLTTMARYNYSLEEMARVVARPESEIETSLARWKIASAPWNPVDRVAALPYPGGRHPRIGFLEGAIDPHRGTKAGVFPPWPDAGYVVIDIPEAIFEDQALIYLAHTHIPTIWDDEDVIIDNIDWTIGRNGELTFSRELPNKISFGARVVPAERHANLELWLRNGTDRSLSKLRTQVCVMLKGAPAFVDAAPETRFYGAQMAQARALDADRWVSVSFDKVGRTWGNAKCPCIHADPVFPDAAPGETVKVTGRIDFIER